MSTLPFRKMNGLGNDFLVVDLRHQRGRAKPEVIAALADRGAGIGFDQFIAIEKSSSGADAFMRINNADGGEVAACGNGTRCVAWLLMAESGQDTATIETRAGLLRGRMERSGRRPTIAVDMGTPRFGWSEIPLAEAVYDTRAIELDVAGIDGPALQAPSVVGMGNPHVVFWVADLWLYDLERFGPQIETHPMFPERVNVTLAHVEAPDAIAVRTWERGVGLTRACGTAACATLVCAARTERSARKATIRPPGGTLVVEWTDDDHVWMTGPAELEFTGRFDPRTGAFSRDS